MADAVTTQILADGPRNTIVKLTSVSDGTGESAVTKVDISNLNGSPTSVRIKKIEYDVKGMGVNLLWDAATPVQIASLSAGTGGEMEFEKIGGLTNNAGPGTTGNLLLSTTGASNESTYMIILHLKKKYRSPANA